MPRSSKWSLSFGSPLPPPIPVLTDPSHILATFFSHLILLDLITQIIFGEEYSSWNCCLYSFPLSPVTISHLDPDIFLGSLFSDTLSLRSSLKVTSLYILIFKIWIAQRKTENSEPNYSRNSLISISS